jgi:hypothetical protein
MWIFFIPALVTAIGINLGNVLEAPVEGAWAPVAQEYYFDGTRLLQCADSCALG